MFFLRIEHQPEYASGRLRSGFSKRRRDGAAPGFILVNFWLSVSGEKSVTVTHCVAGPAWQTTSVMQERLASIISLVFSLIVCASQVFFAMSSDFVVHKLQQMCNCNTFFLWYSAQWSPLFFFTIDRRAVQHFEQVQAVVEWQQNSSHLQRVQ